MVRRLDRSPLASDVILNVNVPDVPFAALSGIRSARLGFRHKSEPVIQSQDPHGRTIYWIGPAGPGQDAGEGTDFHAISEGAVSVTPLKVDLTRHDTLPKLQDWLSGQ
jgi:5'-nucleotidase